MHAYVLPAIPHQCAYEACLEQMQISALMSEVHTVPKQKHKCLTTMHHMDSHVSLGISLGKMNRCAAHDMAAHISAAGGGQGVAKSGCGQALWLNSHCIAAACTCGDHHDFGHPLTHSCSHCSLLGAGQQQRYALLPLKHQGTDVL